MTDKKKPPETFHVFGKLARDILPGQKRPWFQMTVKPYKTLAEAITCIAGFLTETPVGMMLDKVKLVGSRGRVVNIDPKGTIGPPGPGLPGIVGLHAVPPVTQEELGHDPDLSPLQEPPKPPKGPGGYSLN